jgi:hypothetical protein
MCLHTQEDTGRLFVAFKTLWILAVKLELKNAYVQTHELDYSTRKSRHSVNFVKAVPYSSVSNADKAKMVTNKCLYKS